MMARNATQLRMPCLLRRTNEGGQSIVESCLVIILVCLIFFGFLQVALLYNDERVLQFASFAAARSATVGFNQDTFTRAYRAAAIPASGTNLAAKGLGPKELLGLERIGIPLYLNNDPVANLNYDYWDSMDMTPQIYPDSAAMLLAEYHS